MDEFFERQTAKNCSIHSLNNALGWVVITPEEVAGEIERRIASYAKTLDLPLDDKKVRKYAGGLYSAEDITEFSAESVWYAAVGLGRCALPERIYDFSLDKYGKSHLIFLGKDSDGTHHAVGARDGYIYDSLNMDGPPVLLTEEELAKIYKVVQAIYVV